MVSKERWMLNCLEKGNGCCLIVTPLSPVLLSQWVLLGWCAHVNTVHCDQIAEVRLCRCHFLEQFLSLVTDCLSF